MSTNIIILLVIVGLSIVFLLISKITRGCRRISARLAGFLVFIPSITILSVLFFSQGGGEAVSLTLSVAGIVISFIFGVAGKFLSITGSSKVRVGIVISSKDPFHQEIRRELFSKLDSVAFQIFDFGAAPDAPREDLTVFHDLLSKTLTKQVDYLVMWPPGGNAANQSDVREATDRLRCLGGLCIFLENGPDMLYGTKLNHALIRHNAEEGAKLLADGVRHLLADTPSFNLLVLLGPEFSEPAKLRNNVLISEFPEGDGISHLQLEGWSTSDALNQLITRVKQGCIYDALLCPNDNIALEVVDALFNRPDLMLMKDTKVIGFDGLPRASACIAEYGTNFQLTVTIPPREYGRIAADIIKQFTVPSFRPEHLLRKKCLVVDIPMDHRNLIDKGRARRRLYDVSI